MKNIIETGIAVGLLFSLIFVGAAAFANFSSLSNLGYWWELTKGFFVVWAVASFVVSVVACLCYRFVELVIEDKRK